MNASFSTGLLIQAVLLALAMVFTVYRQAAKIKDLEETIEYLATEINVLKHMFHTMTDFLDEVKTDYRVADEELRGPRPEDELEEELPF